MSRTLNLVDLPLNSGRHCSEIGRTQEAIDILARLAEFRKLPAPVLEEVQDLLADLFMRQDDYAQARRHLLAALAIAPESAKYHHMMAIAIEEDDDADMDRAEEYFARAVELDPQDGYYWLDYASYLLRAGKQALGLKSLRQAFKLGIDDPEIVGQVAELLREEGRFDEARAKLRATLFRHHGDRRFRDLWQQHQFQTVRHEQAAQQTSSMKSDAKPVFLPFVAAESTGKFADIDGRTLRIDQSEAINGPKSKQPMPTSNPQRRPQKG